METIDIIIYGKVKNLIYSYLSCLWLFAFGTVTELCRMRRNYETNCDAMYSNNINWVYLVDTTDNGKWHLSTVDNCVLASLNEILFPGVLQLGY